MPSRANRSCCASGCRAIHDPRWLSRTQVYGEVSKATADLEDFALLRSTGVPTYHMASCADDADLRITDVLRGQEHLANTYKHVLIFEALGVDVPKMAHLPLLMAPDGAKLSKRVHGPVVSVTTYRDAGFLPHAFVNFLCLLGWSAKNDREKLSREELIELFSLDGINRSNATVNFTDEDPFDPKATWLNAEHLRGLDIDELAQQLMPYAHEAGFANATPEKLRAIAPLIRERIRLLSEVGTAADFFFQGTAVVRPRRAHPKERGRRHGRAGTPQSERCAGRGGRLRSRNTRDRASRRRRGTGGEGGTDVSTRPRGGMRPEELASAF